MKPLGHLMTHFRLVSCMARAVGVDPETARAAGALSQRAWADMVQTCRRCGWEGCEDWLNKHETAEHPPEACPNAARILSMRGRVARLQEA
ncbi:DUF6455 family protein [Jhaorihella thermophila]|uniref:DUF6455 domain-containing protein n=1 Tax=Jhaorihella thermophila TaxID=488547 RepID=A0A1H5X0V5_9RHOB|nr:DUF6455 family protein [Jhaorihella thermophila]SEG05183.1 hypothetical protein SAMN05421751_109118 [Jhaorihella thermophila]